MAVDDEALARIRDMNFPKSAIYNRVIAKEAIIKAGRLKQTDQNLLIKDVLQINWVLLLTEQNTKIPDFVSDQLTIREIDYIHVRLKRVGNLKKIVSLVLGTIPKATILEIEWDLDTEGKRYLWATAEYNVKRQANNLLTAGAVHMTVSISNHELQGVLKNLDFDTKNHLNLERLYNSYGMAIEKFNLAKELGREVVSYVDYGNLNDRIASLTSQITVKSNEAKKEKQLNKRALLVKEVRRLKDELAELKGQIQ